MSHDFTASSSQQNYFKCSTPHQLLLLIRMDNDAPKEFMDSWMKNVFEVFMKGRCHPIVANRQYSLEQIQNCENCGKFNHLLHEWRSTCCLSRNKNLGLLDRCDGLLGGDNNWTDRQIRYCRFKGPRIELESYSLILYPINSSDKNDCFTIEELLDLVNSLTNLCNRLTNCQGCRGRIVIEGYD